jgi:hypothetical protein
MAAAADVAAAVADAVVTAAAAVEIAAVAVAEAAGNFQLFTEIKKSVFGYRLKTLFYFQRQFIEKHTSLISAMKNSFRFLFIAEQNVRKQKIFYKPEKRAILFSL